MIQKTHCIGEVDADPDEEATKMADSPGSVVQVALSAISLPIEIEKRINVTVASGFFWESHIYTIEAHAEAENIADLSYAWLDVSMSVCL